MEKTMDSKSIKNAFLSFFENNGHKIIQGSSLLPKGDLTLLFINSGMAPMKSYFTGAAAPPHPRLANIQPCIRTNDIDDVGDMHHLTFFEMLGSWSINDYYKEDAIAFAYKLLTQGLKIDPNRLYFSVYSGNPDLGLSFDDLAYKAWQDAGVPKEKIIALGDEDNFWGPAGGEGPCGPCTEVFIDTGVPGDENSYELTGNFDTKNRYVEIWNAGVFMEFYKDKAGVFSKLKQHNVDTGAGLERLTMALNGLSSVYETDIYQGLNEVINSATSQVLVLDQEVKAKRIIADHMRAVTFILAEGVLPDKNREGYIPRRLIRRCVAANSRLNIENFPYNDAIDAVLDYAGDDYPHLKNNADIIKTLVMNEEVGFSKTIRMGEKAIKKVITQGGSVISGQNAFNLTASHGIPLDILLTMVEQQGGTIDVNGYNDAMKDHRNISRNPK